MAIEISESPGHQKFMADMANILRAIEFDVDSLPEPWKAAFEGPAKLIAGSKTSLGIIGEKQQLPLIRLAELILSEIYYADFINYNLSYIAKDTSFFGVIINTGMAKDGRFLLEGPMSRQFISQTQTLVEHPVERRRVYRR